MSPLLLRQVIVMDSQSEFHGLAADVLIADGRIQDIALDLSVSDENISVYQASDAATLHLSPGFVDLFADYREPGFEQKETIQSGLQAAARGGFTDVFLLPNTKPVTDGRSGVQYAIRQAKGQAVRLHPLGAVSQGIEGKYLAEMMDMRAMGAIAFSDGWKPIQSSGLMLKALEYVHAFSGIIIQLPIDQSLAVGGLMHESARSTHLGMPGIPTQAESLQVYRDIELLRYSNSKLHITGISAAASVALIRQAKAEGLQLTCSVTPYHLLLTDEALEHYDSAFKVNPPLRSEADRQALIAGLADGTIDCIATHHRPQDWDAKAKEFESAGEGMAIQEIALSLVLQALGDTVKLDRVLDAFSTSPRRIFGLSQVAISKGSPAACTLFSPDALQTFKRESAASLAFNNPFDGQRLPGIIHRIITPESF
ncbi:MAG: dihydroorotase [Bacteroidetes bacterium]|nr:dihydroorotase [Bacteroidota bacterium]